MNKAFPVPTAAPVWPIPGDVPDLNAIVGAQAGTIQDQEALLHAYQGALNAAQTQQPAATGTGNSSGGVQLTTSAVTGTIVVPCTVTGSGVAAGLTITGQSSGTPGGAGIYTTNVATTLTSAALTFTPAAPSWPIPQDATTLTLIAQQQTAVIRTQTALLQHYQDLLNTSQTPPPPTGP